MAEAKSQVRSGFSWGRYPAASQSVKIGKWRGDVVGDVREIRSFRDVLPYGRGRSYGDVCLNTTGTLLDLSHLDHVVTFDRISGVITAEAGITLRQILELVVPEGWFLPVTPGTSWVTLGGAIANDVHGKNHHRAGTFGRHVLEMTLAREGTIMRAAPDERADLFSATIGGLGLTGVIVTAALQLVRIADYRIRGDSIKFNSLEEFFDLSRNSDRDFEYTVAWLDCLCSSGVRGLFMRGNHAQDSEDSPNYTGSYLRSRPIKWKSRWELATVPLDVPGVFVRPLTMRCFNFAYYNKQQKKLAPIDQSFEPFFYPLDLVGGWNKLYGAQGFFQFQCVVPHAVGEPGIREVIEAARRSGAGSFLAVLKEFGDIPSPGMLSFPRPGYTLCLDFANQGTETVKLMKYLEEIVIRHGGALYPAKDALMSRSSFEHSYPRVHEFSKFIEPGFNSDFWRRVTAS